jgi:hypothetical protein
MFVHRSKVLIVAASIRRITQGYASPTMHNGVMNKRVTPTA